MRTTKLPNVTTTGCEKLYREQVSSVAQREQLDQALDYVRDGDTFTVTKLESPCLSASVKVSPRSSVKGAKRALCPKG